MADMTREEMEALVARVPEGHTPGPWYPVFNGHFWDISLDVAPMSHSVADTCASNSMYGEHMGPDGQPGNHGEANAALIALAPDLAAALSQTLARAAELEEALVAGWEACRRSVYAVCEDARDTALAKMAGDLGERERGFYSAEASLAKSIARAFGAIEARNDDNLLAAIRALAALSPTGAASEGERT